MSLKEDCSNWHSPIVDERVRAGTRHNRSNNQGEESLDRLRQASAWHAQRFRASGWRRLASWHESGDSHRKRRRTGIAGKTLAAGTYTLWVKRVAENAWVLAFHPKTQDANGKPCGGRLRKQRASLPNSRSRLKTAKDSADPLSVPCRTQKARLSSRFTGELPCSAAHST